MLCSTKTTIHISTDYSVSMVQIRHHHVSLHTQHTFCILSNLEEPFSKTVSFRTFSWLNELRSCWRSRSWRSSISTISILKASSMSFLSSSKLFFSCSNSFTSSSRWESGSVKKTVPTSVIHVCVCTGIDQEMLTAKSDALIEYADGLHR